MSAQLVDELLDPDGSSALRGMFVRLLPPGAPAQAVGAGGGLGLISAITRDALGPERDLPAEAATSRLGQDAFAGVLVRAMIAAARSDGRLSDEELLAMASALDHDGLASGERGLLEEELRRPPTLEQITRGLRTREETVAVYVASVLATDPARAVSRHFLHMLAARLGLEAALTQRIEAAVRARQSI